MTPEIIAELRQAGEALAYTVLGVIVLLAALKTWRTLAVLKAGKGDPEV